jgi:hypothetical protein
MKKRDHVLAMVCALVTILMLDRVCLSVAGPRMQAALHIDPRKQIPSSKNFRALIIG